MRLGSAGAHGRSNPAPRDAFTDWDRLDWKFNRASLAGAYLFERLRPDDPFSKYQREISLGALRPLTLAEFDALSASRRRELRRQSESEREQAMSLRRSLQRGWEIWTLSRTGSVPDEAMSDEMGIVIPAIGHLRRATALDPGYALAWYDLGYFAGIVGDRRLQRSALESGLRALTSRPETAVDPAERDDLRLRLLLDLAWLDRDEGFYRQGLDRTDEALARIRDDGRRTLDIAREALLLRALLLVDVDEIHAARRLARDWPAWRLPLQPVTHQGDAGSGPVVQKESLEHVDSDFARDWVWLMTFLKLGSRDEALALLSERDWRTEFPPHLNHRYWQDRGRVLESFGERERSRLGYAFAILFRPYFPYFPLDGARGFSQVLDQTGSGQDYFLGCGQFFVGGSFYSYAANRVMAMELSATEDDLQRHGAAALDALDACLRRDIQPARALALRGRAHFRLGHEDEAIADLVEANEHLKSAGLPRAETLKLLAVTYFNRRDYRHARLWSDELLSVAPDDDFGWCLAGLSTAHLGGLDFARTALEHARELNPQSESTWYNLALIHLQQGDAEQARVLLDEALRRFPADANIAQLHQMVAEQPDVPYRMVGGQAELEVAVQDERWRSWAAGSTDVDLSAGVTPERAREMLPRLRRLYGQDPSPRNRVNLARILLRAERPDEVQDLLARDWPDDLSREEALLLLNADRATGNARRAAGLARRLLNQPDAYPDAEFWTLAAVICLENGAQNAARRALDRARRLDPDNGALSVLSASLAGP